MLESKENSFRKLFREAYLRNYLDFYGYKIVEKSLAIK